VMRQAKWLGFIHDQVMIWSKSVSYTLTIVTDIN
jgi:hypothetical protein